MSESTQTIDPITFEVIRHRLWAINDEQARMAARLSGSTIVYEAYDLNAALMTADGRGLYCGVYIMHHGSTIDEFVRRILADRRSEEVREGDMFFTNDPWWGALHANDGILAMPIFWEGQLVAWSGIVMHDSDVGSPVPGSFVNGAVDRFGEAPLFPAIRMVERFEPLRDVERAYLRNSRTPELNALNMRARVAALRLTHGRVCELIDHYGLPTFRSAQEGIIDYVERVVRTRLREIPDGSWFAHGYHDGDGVREVIYPIRCRVTKDGDRLLVDMTGTAPQAPGAINCARPALEGVVLGVILTYLCYDLPWAIGGLRRVASVQAPDGTLVTAISPAGVSMASIMASLTAQDVIEHAFAEMLLCSERHRGEAQGTWGPGICGGTFAETRADGTASIAILSESFGGGGGARVDADGLDTGGAFHSMAARIGNVEAHESRGRLLEIFRREARDGGGAGRFRGGAGVEYCVTPHKADGDCRLLSRSSGMLVPSSHGLAGGAPGAPVRSVALFGSDLREQFARGRVPLGEADLAARETRPLAPKAVTPLVDGDVVISTNAGGGGYGDPLRRDAARVARDIGEGMVSEAVAREVYGVVAPGGALDAELTERRRAEIRAARGASGRPQTAAPAGRHPIGDAISADAKGLRCALCGEPLGGYGADQRLIGTIRELPLTALGERFARCLDAYTLREQSCPGCGTALAFDVAAAGEVTPGARLRPID